MLRFLSLVCLFHTALTCAPGSGNDIATMTLYTNEPYPYPNPGYYMNRVQQEMRKVLKSYGANYDPNYVKISTRGVDGKLVVTVQALLVDCGKAPQFMSKLKSQSGFIQRAHLSCSNGKEFNA